MKQELPTCPVEITMGLIGDKWKILIIRDLLTGTKRFGELRKSLNGISQKVLTNNLRDMEKSGLVHREAFAEVPPRVFAYGNWMEFKACFIFYGSMGK